MSRADILAAAREQFAEVNKRLDTQLTRIAQIQQQLDLQHKEAEGVRQELVNLQRLLQQLFATTA